MNIFIFDEDISLCARYYCDKYAVKMPLEFAQLLCTAHHLNNSSYDTPYKPTHRHHPCAKWSAESLENYVWLVNLGLKLCEEYTYRYGKVHKCEEIINWCGTRQPDFQSVERTPFALAMPDQYKCEDAVKAYRDYYLGEKRHLFAWKKRPVPWWVEESL